MIFLLTDVESTGLKPDKSFILSNGSILWNNETDKFSEFYEILNWKKIFPDFHIPEETIKVHGITEEIMQKEGIHPVESMCNFYKWIIDFSKDSDKKLNATVAFNLPYDLNMFISNLKYLKNKVSIDDQYSVDEIENISNLLDLLSKDYDDEEIGKPLFIDSLIVDQIFHFEVDGEKVYHNLDDVGNRYGLPSDPNAHNAIADTRRMFKIFKIQLKEIQEKGIEIDQKFEKRLIKRYNRNQDYWGKSNSLDYLANNMIAVKY